MSDVDPFAVVVERAIAGEDQVLTRHGVPVAVLVGADRYDELMAALDSLGEDEEG